MEFWLWICVLVGSVILEFVTVSALISIWFSVGAIGALIVMEIGLPFVWQVSVFFVISILFIIVCRPMATKYLRGNIVPTNADRVIGQQAKLLEAITPDQWGLVKIQGVEWHAISSDTKSIEKGVLVEVLSIEGSKVIVKKI
ncbi:NfeD family protein [Anaerorhabdus sp.]|uniref:NfeD family protein n=1 Tax=Anaerorhabdus sp. TaxID=1872524 RepID=UPI002B1F3B9C|nr:NfeD family protein [Anaerorhabdus sp.]MEA4874567.1 NfeD family protein [Anaerorhabdus sp.]